MSLILFLVSILITGYAQFKVYSEIKKASKVTSSNNLTGQEIAAKILQSNGIHNVEIVMGKSSHSDYYDSKNKILSLSPEVFKHNSIAACAISAHECGHALQDKENYSYLTLRQNLYPLVSFSSYVAPLLIMAGFFFSSVSALKIGILFFSVSLFFTLITLPVEFDASKRAMAILDSQGFINSTSEHSQTKKVLDAAALTYVAAFITSLLELIRLILIANSQD